MNFFKKIFLTIVTLSIIASLSLTFTGCPKKPAEPTEEAEACLVDPSDQEITFWHVSTKIHEEVLLEMIDTFNSENEYGITVKPEYGGYYPDLREKILAAIAAESPPDLAISYQNMIAEYAEAEVIQPLDDYLLCEKYGLSEEDLNDYFKAFIEGDRYPAFDNKILSWPPNRSMEVMFYNIDKLNELGYDNPPETWEEFKEMCKAAKDSGMEGYCIAPSASTFAGWVWSRGGELLSEDGKETVFKEQGIEALTFLKEEWMKDQHIKLQKDMVIRLIFHYRKFYLLLVQQLVYHTMPVQLMSLQNHLSGQLLHFLTQLQNLLLICMDHLLLFSKLLLRNNLHHGYF